MMPLQLAPCQHHPMMQWGLMTSVGGEYCAKGHTDHRWSAPAQEDETEI